MFIIYLERKTCDNKYIYNLPQYARILLKYGGRMIWKLISIIYL